MELTYLMQDDKGNADSHKVNTDWNRICKAVEAGQIETVKYYIENNVKPLWRNIMWSSTMKWKWTYDGPFPDRFSFGHVLEAAAHRNHIEMVKVLLELGALVNWKTSGKTVLHRAVRNRNKDVTQLLLQYGADPNIYSDYNEQETPLHKAARLGFFELVEMLLVAGADVNAADVSGQTALSLAINLSYWNIVDTLLARNPTIDDNLLGKSAGFNTLSDGRIDDIIANLTKCQLPATVFPGDHDNAIFSAIRTGNDAKAKLLKNNDVLDLAWNTTFQITPLHVAVFYERAELIPLLLSLEPAVVFAMDGHGCMPVHYAMEMDSIDMFAMLLRMTADYKNEFLLLAVTSKQAKLVEHVLANGANVLARFDDKSILEFACDTNHAETISMLLACGADPNQYSGNETLLHKFFYSSNVANLLLEYGADINKVDGEGNTPLTRPLPRLYGVTPYRREVDEARRLIVSMALSLDAAGSRLCKQNLDRLNYYINSGDFDDENKEVRMGASSTIKQAKLQNCSLTVYDILTSSVDRVAKIPALHTASTMEETHVFDTEYRAMYGRMLRAQLYRAKARRKYLDKGQAAMQIIFTDLPLLCIDNIVFYLNNEDLNNLSILSTSPYFPEAAPTTCSTINLSRSNSTDAFDQLKKNKLSSYLLRYGMRFWSDIRINFYTSLLTHLLFL